MDHDKNSIPYIVFESTMARFERIISRLWIALLITILLLIGTNLAWICYEQQFEDTVTTYTQDLDTGDGGDAIINDGVHINGESKTVGNN